MKISTSVTAFRKLTAIVRDIFSAKNHITSVEEKELFAYTAGIGHPPMYVVTTYELLQQTLIALMMQSNATHYLLLYPFPLHPQLQLIL